MQEYVDFPGYQVVVKDSLTTVIKKGYTRSFQDFRIPDAKDSRNVSSPHRGRAQLIPFPLFERPEERALVRRYVRGGVLGRFLKGKYLNWGKPRPLKELEVSEFARSQGIPTPEILAAAVERSSHFFYRGAIAVREISPGEDLQTLLLKNGQSFTSEIITEKRKMAASLGRLIAKMHKAGIYHADLHLKNILLSKGAHEELYLLDLDAARIYGRLSDFRKCMNLLRLLRSVEKMEGKRRPREARGFGFRVSSLESKEENVILPPLRQDQNDKGNQKEKEMDSRLSGNDNSQGQPVKKIDGISHVVAWTDLLRFLQSYAEELGRPVEDFKGKLLRMLPLWRLKWKLSDILGV
ncbi:MAG: hypothetical protein HY801_03495 [Candidatus Lindowbacteria bacterium]|nr:hypothetical protein [Candidatus Lindowbacteria bacterium]